ALRSCVGVGFVALLLDTAYVWAFAEPTVPYMAAVIAHLAIGVLVVTGGAVLFARDGALRQQPALWGVALGLAVAAALAGDLIIAGNVTDHRWALRGHIIAACAAVAAMLPYGSRLATRGLSGERWFGRSFQAAALLLAVFPAAV